MSERDGAWTEGEILQLGGFRDAPIARIEGSRDRAEALRALESS